MDIYKKLKAAREMLGLNQRDAAKHANVSQRDISMLENGNKKFVPNEYIQFLNNNGIDINSIYDSKNESVVTKNGNLYGNLNEKINQLNEPEQQYGLLQKIREENELFKKKIEMLECRNQALIDALEAIGRGQNSLGNNINEAN